MTDIDETETTREYVRIPPDMPVIMAALADLIDRAEALARQAAAMTTRMGDVNQRVADLSRRVRAAKRTLDRIGEE
jgi:hypothetical protein